MLQLNSPAPTFSLKDQDGTIRSLEEFKGKWVVVYFYPKDDTPGCTKEACSFRDGFEDLTKNNVQVLGISKDTVPSHKRFAQKYNLNFPLLSDQSKETIRHYHALGMKKFMGREFEGILRNTYLINPEGLLVKVYENVKPADHAQEIISDIQQLAAKIQ